jgi:hypothetical protein
MHQNPCEYCSSDVPTLYVYPMEKHELDLVTSTCTLSCNAMLHDCTRHIYMQRLCFRTRHSAQIGRKPWAANLRPPLTQDVLRAKGTQDGDVTWSQTPNPKGGLHVHLRPTRRVFALGINPMDWDSFHRKRTRTALHTRGATYGVVPIPLSFLQVDVDFRKLLARP